MKIRSDFKRRKYCFIHYILTPFKLLSFIYLFRKLPEWEFREAWSQVPNSMAAHSYFIFFFSQSRQLIRRH